MESMQLRLGTTALVTQLPLGSGRSFRGLIDLVAMETLSWEPGSDGQDFVRRPLAEASDLLRLQTCSDSSDPVLHKAIMARASLADQVRVASVQGGGWEAGRV